MLKIKIEKVPTFANYRARSKHCFAPVAIRHNRSERLLRTGFTGSYALARPGTGKTLRTRVNPHPRLLAVMHALVRFAQIAAGNTFSTAEIHPHTVDALGGSADKYSLSSLRYDLSKLRAKKLMEKLPHSRRYRLAREGYSIGLVFLKLFGRIYAPLTAGLLHPFSSDSNLQQQKRTQLDRLYQKVVDDLDKLIAAVGLKAAA